jgi:5'-nucleotidase
MRILLTNDDGIDSTGIQTLAKSLAREHRVFVVAPNGNRSGVSHAVTTHSAITLERFGDASIPSYACSGTPADCVFLGVTKLEVKPDLVVSGINFGPNLADDVNYSGTVAGAIEASLLGIPAIAVSLAADHEQTHATYHWETATEIARRCIAPAYEQLRSAESYWNINVPNRPLQDISGIAVTTLGRKRICGRMTGEEDRSETRYYRAWESPFATDRETIGTDIEAVHDGYASVTPLLVDRTDRLAFASMKRLSELL